MLEQIFQAEERMSDVGFGPIEEDAPTRRNNDVPRIQIQMAQSMRDSQILEPSQGIPDSQLQKTQFLST
jgi:hypothetical protein